MLLLLVAVGAALAGAIWTGLAVLIGFRAGQRVARGQGPVGNPVGDMLSVAKEAEAYFEDQQQQEAEAEKGPAQTEAVPV